MDVLVFECDDYKLIVSTGSIEYAWHGLPVALKTLRLHIATIVLPEKES